MALRHFCPPNPTYSRHLAANFGDVVSVPVRIMTQQIIVVTLKQKVKEANGGSQRRHLAVGRRNRTGD